MFPLQFQYKERSTFEKDFDKESDTSERRSSTEVGLSPINRVFQKKEKKENIPRE